MSDAEQLARKFYSALARSNTAEAASVLSPRIEWKETFQSPQIDPTGELALGVDSFMDPRTGEFDKLVDVVTGTDGLISSVLDPTDGDFEDVSIALINFISRGAIAAVPGMYKGRNKRSGKELNAPFVHLWSAQNGTLTQFLNYIDRTTWLAAHEKN